MALSNLPGPWYWELRGKWWWRINRDQGIEDGPHEEPLWEVHVYEPGNGWRIIPNVGNEVGAKALRQRLRMEHPEWGLLLVGPIRLRSRPARR